MIDGSPLSIDHLWSMAIAICDNALEQLAIGTQDALQIAVECTAEIRDVADVLEHLATAERYLSGARIYFERQHGLSLSGGDDGSVEPR